jgi:hypothetical protein
MGYAGLGCAAGKPVRTYALIRALLPVRTCGPNICCVIKGEKERKG